MSIRPSIQLLRRSTTISGGGFALIGALLVMSGCSDSTTSPAGLAISEALGGGASIERLDTDSRIDQWTVEQRVGNQGGTMLLDGQELKLSFPPKTLPGLRTIIARVRLNDRRGAATQMDLDLQPALTFRHPVELSVSPSYLAGTASSYKLLSYDQPNSRWQVLDEKKIGANGVVFTINDSSIHYAVSR